MPASIQWHMAVQGDLRKLAQAPGIAATLAIRSATNRLKNQGRKQMERAGLGTRLPKALRGRVVGATGRDITRRGIDESPTGIVFSTAIKKGTGGSVDLIDVFEHGATIQAKGGTYTAIPTAAAGGRRAAPLASYPEGTFRIVPVKRARGRSRRGGVRAAFVAVNKADNAVWYILVPAFPLKRRLRLSETHARIAAGIPAAIDRSYARALVRLGAV